MLFSIALMMLRNKSDAQDVTQNVFLKLIEKLHNFKNENHEKAFLIRVTLNLCKDRLRLKHFWREVPLSDNLSYSSKENNELLMSVMKLPIKYRSVLILFYYNDYSIAEIAKITGRRPATVGSQLQRARIMLKNIFEGDADDEQK